MFFFVMEESTSIGKIIYCQGLDQETFMEWVSDLVKEEFQIGQKDNWNPADIWLIQNEMKWRKQITKSFNQKRDPRLGIYRI